MRPTISTGVAALSSVALLVLGLDYATHEATGDSLILGHANHANQSDGAATIARHGEGAALTLTSAGNARSKARHRTVTFTAGARGDVEPGAAFWSLNLRPGVYAASFRAFVTPDTVPEGTTVDVICGVADLNTLGPNTRVYAADSATYSNRFPSLMSGAETVHVSRAANPGIVCTTSNNADFTLSKPITSSWARVHRTLKTARPVNATLEPTRTGYGAEKSSALPTWRAPDRPREVNGRPVADDCGKTRSRRCKRLCRSRGSTRIPHYRGRLRGLVIPPLQ